VSGLYIHVPFCVRKCAYCDFYSIPLHSDPEPTKPLHRRTPSSFTAYLEALELELQRLDRPFDPSTVYIGGGTPTVLPPDRLRDLLRMIHQHVSTAGVREWTCEVNPGTCNGKILDILLRKGVNRLSLGIQSFQDRMLNRLGRVHTASQAHDAIALLKARHVENFSLDLMYGIPDQTMAILDADLDALLEHTPPHVSCYALSFEPSTPFYHLRERGHISEMDDAQVNVQYHHIRKRLKQAGYRHYEISNFALAGYECRHNLLYWGPGTYQGCGPAASSHWKKHRYGNHADLAAWSTALRRGQSSRAYDEQLSDTARACEALVMGLRRISGIHLDTFLKETGYDAYALRGEAIRDLCSAGLLVESSGYLRLSEQALFVSNSVFAQLV
jgi:oxygen-independent coproporphyrinogen-3 oxidase